MLFSDELGEDPPVPARHQTPATAAVERGVSRLLFHMGYSPLAEVPVKPGRRVDVAGIDKKGNVLVVEIKSSLADFRADKKWPDYLDCCDKFYFAVPPDFPRDVIPDNIGLIVADRYGGEVLREGPVARISAARRKSVMLRFARTASSRIMRRHDPMGTKAM